MFDGSEMDEFTREIYINLFLQQCLHEFFVGSFCASLSNEKYLDLFLDQKGRLVSSVLYTATAQYKSMYVDADKSYFSTTWLCIVHLVWRIRWMGWLTCVIHTNHCITNNIFFMVMCWGRAPLFNALIAHSHRNKKITDVENDKCKLHTLPVSIFEVYPCCGYCSNRHICMPSCSIIKREYISIIFFGSHHFYFRQFPEGKKYFSPATFPTRVTEIYISCSSLVSPNPSLYILCTHWKCVWLLMRWVLQVNIIIKCLLESEDICVRWLCP